jgi:hypothetical protein
MLRPLTRVEKVLVGLILFGWVAFGCLVEYRSAFLRRRMGDVGVYFRAGWAVRTGGRSLYSLTDDNGWHYHYPPLFAILCSPLADPPTRDLTRTVSATVGVGGTPAGPLMAVTTLASCPSPLEPDLSWSLPFPVSVAIFYALNLLCLGGAAHLLASALERHSQVFGVSKISFDVRRWWWLRLLPVFLCLPPIGHTLVRGQANVFLLLAMCGALAASLNGRKFSAGFWLSGAICLKLFPGYLLLLPLWRRDLRYLVGCASGLLLGLVLIPVLALGPEMTLRCYSEQFECLVRPGLNLGGDASARAKELIEATATDNQAFQALIHNGMHPNREQRPDIAAPWVGKAHWLLGAVLTGVTLLAIRRGERGAGNSTLKEAIGFSALVLLMVLLSPVCHLHYMTLAVPMLTCLMAVALERDRVDGWFFGTLGLFVVFLAANIVPLLPGMEFFRDVGLAGYSTLALWAAGCATVAWYPVPGSARSSGGARERRLAA